jgi:hypothetical protein
MRSFSKSILQVEGVTATPKILDAAAEKKRLAEAEDDDSSVKRAKNDEPRTDPFAKGYDKDVSPTGSYINKPDAVKDTLEIGSSVDCWCVTCAAHNRMFPMASHI